jgi:hypothetical protein
MRGRLHTKTQRRKKYKELGKGYTSIMADVLSFSADNPDILYKVRN